MTFGRKIKQWAQRLRRRFSKYLPVLLGICLLTACAGLNQGNTNDPTTTTTTTANNAMAFADVRDMNGFMSFLGSKGFAYEDEMEIAGLSSGFVEGRKFQIAGQDYFVYRFNDTNEALNASIQRARQSNSMKMNVGGVNQEVPVFVVGNYLIQYPEDADIDEFKRHFQ